MDAEQQARQRVSETPELDEHSEIIFYDWPNWSEHVRWIATAPIAEIVDWAETITGYSRSVAAAAMGSARSERKTASSRENGKLGGRPRKQA